MPTLVDVRFHINHPRSRWIVAGLLALLTAGVVLLQLKGLQATQTELGETVAVLVASTDIASGSLLGEASTRIELRPMAHTPSGALVQLPNGARVHSYVSRGEILTSNRITQTVAGAVAAQIPAGTVGVAIPLDPLQLGLEQGDRIALYRSLPGQQALLAVASASVISSNEDSLVAAVPIVELGTLLDGLLLGDIAVVLLPAD